jgi:hypothetical protein
MSELKLRPPIDQGFLGDGLDVLEVGVFEVGGVVEAKAEESVEADVGGPDECDGREVRLGGEVGDHEQDRGSEISVREIVESSAEADIGEIPEREEVGRKEKDGEEKPTCVELAVEEDG